MIQSLEQLKKEWRELVSNNKWKDLFDGMQRRVNGQTDAGEKLCLLQSRHTKAHQDEMAGVVSHENTQLAKNQIAQSMLDLIAALRPEDLGGDGSAAEHPLDPLVKSLSVTIPLSTPLYLVNCDRRAEWRSFRRSFGSRQQEGRHFQFYFILACPTQEPEGFAERVVYELQGEHADSHHHSIEYPRLDGGRLRIEPLPLGATLDDSRAAFEKYFGERFDLGGVDFTDFLDNRLPRLQMEFVATALHITAGDWDPLVLEPYVQWIMDRFTDKPNQKPTFLFFFVISLKNAHLTDKIRRDDREALESVDKLVQANADRAALIAPLPPVHTDDLEEWLEKIGHPTRAQKDAILQAIAHTLQSDQVERLQHEQLLDMEPIEDLQERVYRFHR